MHLLLWGVTWQCQITLDACHYFIPSGFIPCSRHLLNRQAWHAFLLFRVISHWPLAGHTYSICPVHWHTIHNTVHYACTNHSYTEKISNRVHFSRHCEFPRLFAVLLPTLWEIKWLPLPYLVSFEDLTRRWGRGISKCLSICSRVNPLELCPDQEDIRKMHLGTMGSRMWHAQEPGFKHQPGCVWLPKTYPVFLIIPMHMMKQQGDNPWHEKSFTVFSINCDHCWHLN